jgi:hypothetical protein
MRLLPAYAALSLAVLSIPAPAQTPPRLAVTPKSVLNFGRVAVGKDRYMNIKLANRGGGTINASWNAHPSDEFSTRFSGGSVDAGRTKKLECRFRPLDQGLIEVPLTITTDDPLRPEVTITLRGRGYFRR